MQFLYADDRIYLENNDQEIIAEITCIPTAENEYIVDHTFVDVSLRGQGIAAKLVKAVVDKARAEGKKIIPECRYAQKEFANKPEYADVLAKD